MKFECKLRHFYIFILPFLLIVLFGLMLMLSYIAISKTDNYLDQAKTLAELKNMTRDEIEKEIEETRSLIFSDDKKIEPFELYAYLVNYKTLRDMYKNANPQSEKNYEFADPLSGRFLDSMVIHLIDAYNINKYQCVYGWFQLLQLLATEIYKDKKAIVNYVDYHKEKLSNYCMSLYKE